MALGVGPGLMAYLRYSRNCDWYVFAQSVSVGSEPLVAIWHRNHRSLGSVFSFSEVLDMLSESDLSSIPGFSQGAERVLEKALEEFVKDEARSS